MLWEASISMLTLMGLMWAAAIWASNKSERPENIVSITRYREEKKSA